MKQILAFLVLLIILGVTAIFSINSLYTLVVTIENILVQIAATLILLFTLVITLRYLALMLFSILKNVQRSVAEYPNYGPLYRVSVIVPAYNEEVVIERSVLSIMEQTYSNLEIVVVDDGSSDRTYQEAKRLENHFGHASIQVLRKPNGGKAKALNYGIEYATGDLIMVVDADSKLSPDAIERMVKYFVDDKIAAVAGSVYVSNRTNILTKLQALEYIQGLNMVRNGQALFRLVNIIPGPIGVFRKDAIREVGGYDSDTFAEDADLTMKLINKGYRVEFEPEAYAYTEAPDKLLDLLKQRYRWTRGILQSIMKHKKTLLHMRRNPSISFVMWYMLFESIFWPVMDISATLFFLYVSTTSGTSSFLIYWWVLFTLLDIAGALYCVVTTKEKLSLVFYAIFYRLYFIGIINIAKLFATVEEWLKVGMEWGKLDRTGGI